MFDEFTVTKSEFVKHFLCFYMKKVISLNFAIFIFANVLLGVSTNCSCVGAFPRREGGIQVLAGPALYSQTIGIHIENSLAGKAGWKNSAKSGLREFTLMEKYTQLLLIKRI